MPETSTHSRILFPVVGLALIAKTVVADVSGVAAGIPEPDAPNAIVQPFNWRFRDVTGVLPDVKKLGYSHVHVSPPQKSNEFSGNGGGAINRSTTA